MSVATFAARNLRRATHTLSPALAGPAILAGALLLTVTAVVTLDLRGQLIFGAAAFLACLALARSKAPLITLMLAFISVAMGTRYLWWRTTETLHFHGPLSAVLGTGLYLAEVYAWIVMIFGFLQCVHPLERQVRPLVGAPETWPTVDIYIPTYNESLDIVQDTVLAALTIDYPPERRRIHLLDDGRRAEFRAFAEAVGVNYITRPDNLHAKAGNLNNAMRQTNGELICIFDADHVATRAFLQMTLGWFQADPRLALLQTPHYFYSPDPIQRNVFAVKDIPGEGDLFYGVVQPGNDFWNAAFFCGSCAVLRRSAIASVGGFAGETVTEDAHTALKMQKRGWNTAYLNLRLAAGLATERLSIHVGQRARWARGMTQIFRIDNPLFGGQLTLSQRLCYLAAMTHFQFGLPRIVFLTAPLAYLLFNQQIVAAPAIVIAAYAAPHLLISVVVNERLHGRDRRAFWGEVYETLLAFHLVAPALLPLIDPKRGKFNVTDKGGLLREGFFDVRILTPLLIAAALLIAGIAHGLFKSMFGHVAASEVQTAALNIGWSIFNLLIVFTAISVGRESRQVRNAVRVEADMQAKLIYEDGSVALGVSRDISMGGVAIVTREPARAGAIEAVELPSGARRVRFPVKLAGREGLRTRLQFRTMHLDQRRELVRVVLGRADAWPLPDSKPHWTAAQSFVDLCRASLSVLLWRNARPAGRRDGRFTRKGRRPAMALSLVGATLALGGLAAIATPVRAIAAPAANPAPPPAAQAPSGVYKVNLSLKDLGSDYPLSLRGVEGEAGVPFELRPDEVVVGATLHLRMAYSPQLLQDLSHMVVALNNEVIANIQLTPDRSGGVTIDLPIDPGLFHATNRLNLRFIGHYTRDCEDPLHSTLWADVSNVRSNLELNLQRVPGAPDLNRLPAPFLNLTDPRPPLVQMVYASTPSNQELQAGAAIASYFGVQANLRPLKFAVRVGQIPAGDPVVLGRAGETVGGVTLPDLDGPRITLARNPSDPFGVMLLVSGRNDAEILTAARGLAQSARAMSGASTQISPLTGGARPAYDAPRWAQTGRSVRLGEFVDPLALQGVGLRPGTLSANLRVAPDLFLWPGTSARLDLGYRYPRGEWVDYRTSRLDVSLNDRYLGSLPLRPSTLADKAEQIVGPGLALRKAKVDLPAYDLFARNRLGFYYDLRVDKRGACAGEVPGDVHANIDPDSRIDLTGGYHFARFPELASFASAGFPFSRHSDLSETSVILPADPTTSEIETLFAVMSRTGASTGAPVTAVKVIRAGEATDLAGRDVLVIGPVGLSQTLPDLFAGAPVTANGGDIRVVTSTRLLDRVFTRFGPAGPGVRWLTSGDDRANQARDAQAGMVSANGFTGLASWISPIDRKRVVVAVLASQPGDLPQLIYGLDDPQRAAQTHGDLAIAGPNGVSAYQVGDTAWIGKLPGPVAALWWLHLHPMALAAGALVLALLLALLVSRALNLRARRRLNPEFGDL
ncbi:UDP-forming cellulose synthase catalytic subunit [Phenylobacterium aquaticum]|uniref:UDP-forming cellulose synthase catalytic subunit n=1 Tax=Phenylobacterium aquaticum TaxID=1763816 RepID=UPI0026EECD0A|nr:UDP-forming cellulose synthase catalytic subunit [Phenylobacterium aquaticum]